MSELNFNFRDVMVDIETWGIKPGSVILSISAVSFDRKTGKLGEEFHVDIDAKSSIELGCSVDGSTILWWMAQSDEARKKLLAGQKKAVHVLQALGLFYKFINPILADKEARVWANSPSFDLSLIEAVNTKVRSNMDFWKYYQAMDVRTISDQFPEFRHETKNEGVIHDGLSDCRYQIAYLVKGLNHIHRQ